MIADLLSIADDLARQGETGRPRQAYLRRSVSSSYYAVFHALAKLCADELIGVSKAGTASWVRVYRALEHGSAKSALEQTALRSLHPAVRTFAETFIELQQKRHTADYDPRPFPFGRRVTLGYTVQARVAIEALSTLDTEHKCIIATTVLLKNRP